MKKFFCVLIAAVVLFSGSKIIKAADCVPPVSCEEHCSGWPTGEERTECASACIRLGLHQEWEDNYNGCLEWQAEEQEREKARQDQQTAQQSQPNEAAQTPGCIRWGYECSPEELKQIEQQKQSQQQPQTNQPTSTQETQSPPPASTPKAQVVNVQYKEMKDIKKGDIIKAPTDKKMDIPLPNGKIDMKEGSSIQYLGQDTWKTISGAFRFLEKVSAKGRLNIKTNGGASVAVRGTQFLTEISADGTTKVAVLKGVVKVTAADVKKSVEVKEGFQTTIDKKGTPAKPAKMDISANDKWYQNIPPGATWFNNSWAAVSAMDKYTENFVTTAGKAISTEALTADEETVLDTFNHNISLFRITNNNSIISKEKKLSISTSKTNVDGTKSLQLFTNGKTVYYPGNKHGEWKGFSDKTLINNLLKAAHDENITYQFDKSSLKFEKWDDSSKTPVAIYNGKLTTAGNKDFIDGALTEGASVGQEIASVKVYVDEESGLWNKCEATVNIKTGKIFFPLKGTCSMTYDTGVKINIPSKFKKVDGKTGLAEMSKIIDALK